MSALFSKRIDATRHEQLAPPIASMILAIVISLQLCVGDDIVSIRLSKPVAVVSASSR